MSQDLPLVPATPVGGVKADGDTQLAPDMQAAEAPSEEVTPEEVTEAAVQQCTLIPGAADTAGVGMVAAGTAATAARKEREQGTEEAVLTLFPVPCSLFPVSCSLFPTNHHA